MPKVALSLIFSQAATFTNIDLQNLPIPTPVSFLAKAFLANTSWLWIKIIYSHKSEIAVTFFLQSQTLQRKSLKKCVCFLEGF